MNVGVCAPLAGEPVRCLGGEIIYIRHPKNYYPEMDCWRVAVSLQPGPGPVINKLLVKLDGGYWVQQESTAHGYPR